MLYLLVSLSTHQHDDVLEHAHGTEHIKLKFLTTKSHWNALNLNHRTSETKTLPIAVGFFSHSSLDWFVSMVYFYSLFWPIKLLTVHWYCDCLFWPNHTNKHRFISIRYHQIIATHTHIHPTTYTLIYIYYNHNVINTLHNMDEDNNEIRCEAQKWLEKLKICSITPAIEYQTMELRSELYEKENKRFRFIPFYYHLQQRE